VLVPLFPGYLFIRFDLGATRWRAINGTRGVIRLLANGPHPLPAPRGLVETLLGKCDARQVISLAALGVLTKGLKIRITSGVFSGQMGEVIEIFAEGRDRVRILLTLLGADTELQLPCSAFEAA
jgi:transcriptional antiterminator RfaH